MEKKTESKTLYDTAKDLENANLRAALADERTKNEALARRCIELGAALDEDARIEKEMIGAVNRHSARRKAETAAMNRRRMMQEIVAYEDACTRNAVFLGLSLLVSAGAAILTLTGIANPILGGIVTGVATIAFGWALNDCLYLLGRCE
jgi:hypothetical protein